MTDTSNADPFDLARFVTAQAGGAYEQALAEIRRGRKRSHCMWFIFPQLAGLGSSPTARHFGIRSGAEDEAYLAHSVLGPRLREIAAAIGTHRGRSATAILGTPDDQKLRSCATLFAAVSAHDPVFQALLDGFYGGDPDPRTLALLAQAAP